MPIILVLNPKSEEAEHIRVITGINHTSASDDDVGDGRHHRMSSRGESSVKVDHKFIVCSDFVFQLIFRYVYDVNKMSQ